MSLSKLMSNYAAYNAWANERMVNWLRTLDTDILYKQTPSSFPSIDLTLQHILRAQKFWFTFISGADTSNFNWGVRENEVEKILDELIEVSDKMKQGFGNFTEVQLQEVLHLQMKWANNNLPRYEYMQHVLNHSAYHRGQIVTMARTLGIEKGIMNMDYNMFNTEKYGTLGS